jgi:two-component system, NtrC family, response regulator HydG
MGKKILIVEDEFVEANHLQMILEKSGHQVCGIASSVKNAIELTDLERPGLVLIDIQLRGKQNGIDLAKILQDRNIAFIFLSANVNRETLMAAKKTEPYGFLVKPFRERDVLVMLDVAYYLHEQRLKRYPSLSQETSLITDDQAFKGVIGESQKLKNILNLVRSVAATDTSVLILGESGTGKEKIVDSIHEYSPRRSKPLIKVNCGTLTASLIESELFGHERGAFTGATERRIGKFELADDGTIFLDEIGELPLDLQVKLLRVLQEKEIERIGGNMPKKINVRVIAATNRNLEKEVAEGRFRMDLYYRLNVYPVTLPPLRERKEDIPLLARYFANHYASVNHKQLDSLSDRVIAPLFNYPWPGNIRELENIMERSVILCENSHIREIILPESPTVTERAFFGNSAKLKTMQESETELILEAIKRCNGKLSGIDGAAALLNIPYSTLTTRIQKLGLKKRNSYDFDDGDKPDNFKKE